MSDSEDSTVTYTEKPPPPDFVPEPIYPEFMPHKDDVLLVEEQPLPAHVSPTADSPGYITKSDPEEDPEEDDEELEEDPTNYPTDKDDDKEKEEESSGDNADDKEEDKDGDKDEEEEHLALANSIPPPACHTTVRMSIRDHTPIPFPSEAEVDRLLAISTPPPSQLTSYSSPLPQIPSLPLPVSSPLPMSPPPLPASPTHSLSYIAAMIRLRVESPSTFHPLPLPPPIILPHTRAYMAMMRAVAPSTYCLAPRSKTPPSGTPPLLPITLATSSLPLLLPYTNHKAGVPKAELPPRKRLCIALGPRYEIGECSSAHTTRPTRGFREQDTDEIYGLLDDAYYVRLLMNDQLNLLRRDKRSHARTTRLMEGEARASRKAWVYRPQMTEIARKGTNSAEDIKDSDGSTTKLTKTC
ncbi:hypothetical protein Tco_1415140 [Tanacetum coccineum]